MLERALLVGSLFSETMYAIQSSPHGSPPKRKISIMILPIRKVTLNQRGNNMVK